ncbi:16S rRNA (cytosine(967)-C(5))-methyltransferase RsmB [Larsenimonas rhizosphaerae]|uniref:16S rRNA (cytosine(967)-C(5))-methyltransferase n=1 Tax=Larsenimonas rhizosphaerae TaxID=2944682 RepID=A0AA42CV10_9GAMM|nr:16S rRNA (cytosine(967)-C(5))-methyltransferase RsmB [Larsenimonas rhizosphaerae]MCX2524541.1 16S rRNA (cytosine(967)-C(5))-methyltransferase RsmB [Larsenimonas rhizosphaerae]
MSQARVQAARTLAQVLRGQASLAAMTTVDLPPRDHGFYKALCFGVCRELPRLEHLAGQLLKQPFKVKDQDIQALLLLGLYQLYYMRVPPHAAVGETAGAARTLKKPWATRVLNGCLRRADRERDALLAAADQDMEASLRHPAWLVDTLKQAWPAHWETIVAANNEAPPMTLRINARSDQTRDAYLARLSEQSIDATATPFSRDGITLAVPCDVDSLPGFEDGDVSVQDEAAQLAESLLAPHLSESCHFLDACCAPGGKTAHLLERHAGLNMIALDNDGARLTRVSDTLTRLGLEAELCEGDATTTDWWNGTAFDAILCDAPCSGTGVIRRHPDIKHLRQPEDLTGLATLQGEMLDSLWSTLAPGGVLLYATCSVIPAENATQIDRFLARTASASALPLPLECGEPAGAGRQLFPQTGGHDGFFYALLHKAAN